MFGTLVINLPSAHTGGLLQLSHAGSATAYDMARCPHSFAAWYSDVTHEVEEVTSGYRLVMTYNLVRGPSDVPFSAATLNQQLYAPVEQAVKNWAAACDNDYRSGTAIYMLDHKYTDANLSFETLKCADSARAHILREVAGQSEKVVFLASMERMQCGEPANDGRYDWAEDQYDSEGNSPEPEEGYRDLDYIKETELKLKRIIDDAGEVIADDMDIDEDHIIQDDPYECREPDDHDYEPYTGNAGAEETHWYRDTVSA